MNTMDYVLAPMIAVALIVGIGVIVFWANKPTKTDEAVYELGFNDGAEGREPEQWDHPRNRETYREGYADGSRGRNRRADAERLQKRLGTGE